MTLSIANFQTRYPEFDSVADARITIFLEDAALELESSKWGDYYDKGAYALTAHMLQLSLDSEAGKIGSVGNVTSKRIGDLAVSFGSHTSDSASEVYYQSTVYGQEYYRLMQLIAPLVFVAHEDFEL